MKRLTYLAVAEIELTEAAEFYEEREPGLGKVFLDAVHRGGEQIRGNPGMWAFYQKPLRSYRILPFPYRLLYRELADRIQIVAVWHLSRHPKSWRNRLR